MAAMWRMNLRVCSTLVVRAALLIAVLVAPAAAQSSATVASFDAERFRGALADSVMVFRGVPYAAAPVGVRRWQPPARRVASTTRAVRDANTFGPACPQTPGLVNFYRNIAAAFGRADSVRLPALRSSEDCLTLNVWAPTGSRRRAPAPVMVWIHGGSNLFGESSSAVYNGAALARRGVVVVSINYRLGALGFMALPELSKESPSHASGNYALLDQIAALQWIKRNIGAVGGDTSRVTLFGESAGAIDIMHLMASPLARGLFHRAIAESGAPMGALPTLTVAEASGVALARALGIDSSANQLDALRRMPADEVVAASMRIIAANPALASPVVDGHVLIESTGKAFDQGRVAAVPLLLGSNALEMSTLRSYVPVFERTVPAYTAWIRRTFGIAAPRALSLYPVAADSLVERTLLQATTHLYMTCPTRFAARGAARATNPVYLYQFTRVIPGGESLGAYHSAEIGYVFGTKESWLPVEPVDYELSGRMMTYWTQFAATGNPNVAGLTDWPQYSETGDRHLELGTTVRSGDGLTRETCDLVQTVLRAQQR
jgi:para-nitrobenzyl esterase